MKCGVCSADNATEAKICHECGNDLTSILMTKGSNSARSYSYRMGEEIKNGIKFWRKTKNRDGNNVLYECICHCGNKFLVKIYYVEVGLRTSCGCRGKRND